MRKIKENSSLKLGLRRPGNTSLISDTYYQRTPKEIQEYDKPAYVSPIQIGTKGPGLIIQIIISFFKKERSSIAEEMQKQQNLHNNLLTDSKFRSKEQSAVDRLESRERMQNIEGTEPTKIS